MHEYDLIADWYRRDRGPTIGVAEALARTRHRVFGLDSSSGMLARLRNTFSGIPVVRADARSCPFRDASFDAVFSWGMVFHLPPREQATMFASVSRALKPGAPFLFTAAEIEDADEGGITGAMNGVTFRYYAVHSYRTLLAEHGFTLVAVHDDPGVSTYFLAHRLP